VINTTFRVRCLQLLRLPPDAEGNPPHYAVSITIAHALLLSKQTTQPNRCNLDSVEALACTDARSDHAVLELFGYLFLSREKGKNNYLLSASTPTTTMLYTALKIFYSQQL
jgi:hypothetical protein